MLVQGPVEAAIISQASKRNLPLPDKIQNAPSLLPGLELYWQGFMDLMSCRQIGMGIGPIWWTTVQDYCRIKELDEFQTEAMHHHIKELDTAYMTHHNKKK